MLIDWINTCNACTNTEELINSPILNIPVKFDRQDGVILENEKHYTKYQGLEFILYPSMDGYKLRLKGSLHKHHNKGNHNADDFKYSDLYNTIDSLWEKFKIDPFKTPLNGLEFGVNINTSKPPKEILRAILSHRGQAFDKMPRSIIKDGYGLECFKNQFIIKIYDKGTQYGKPDDNIIRIEMHVNTMQFLHKKGIEIYYLSDLLNIEILKELTKILKEYISDILIYDTSINRGKLTKNEALLFAKGKNPGAWKPQKEDYKNIREYKKDRKKYDRDREQFVKKFEDKKLKDELLKGIDHKALITNDFNESYRGKFINFEKIIRGKFISCIPDKFTPPPSMNKIDNLLIHENRESIKGILNRHYDSQIPVNL